MTSRFINGGACALTWESFPDDSLAGCGGTDDISARRHLGATLRLHPFIGPMVAILRQHVSPHAAGDWRAALPSKSCGSWEHFAKGEIPARENRVGRRFVGLYRLN